MTITKRLFVQTSFVCWVLASFSVAAEENYVNQLPMEEKRDLAMPFHQALSENTEPFTVIGNVHSVGAVNIGVYLITTSSGHILLDTGTNEMHDSIQDNIKNLGFRVADIKIMLATHAHFDHIQGHAAMQRVTNAQVMALGDDAKALELGQDISPLEFEGWEPVKVNRVLIHEEQVSLGGTTLTAHNIPGHTQGCTVWTMQVVEESKPLEVAFFGCRGPNDGVKLNGNDKFPNLVADTKLGFKRLAALSPDIYLSNHPQEQFARYGDAMRARDRPHPLLQQQPWAQLVEDITKSFNARLQ